MHKVTDVIPSPRVDLSAQIEEIPNQRSFIANGLCYLERRALLFL
jgi:hypothetical protein